MKTEPTYQELKEEVLKLRKELDINTKLSKSLLLENIMRSSTDMSIAATDINLNIIFFNTRAEQIFGYKAEEVIGKNLTEIHSMEKVEFSRIEKAIEIVRETGRYEYFVNTETKEEIKNFKSTIRGIFDKENKLVGYVLYTHDITKEINSQKEIIKLSSTVEQSANAIIITDTEGKIEYGNQKFTDLTEYSTKEIIGKNIQIFNIGIKSKEYYTEMWQTISSGKIWKDEIITKTKSGKKYWEQIKITSIKNNENKIVNYLLIKEDITVRKKVEEELEESKKKYLKIFNNAATSIVIVDKNGLITDINQYHINKIGNGLTRREDYIGKNILTHPSIVASKLSDEYKKVLNGEIISHETVYFPSTTGNISRYYNVRGVPIFNNEEVVEAVFVHEDTSAILKATKKIEESEKKFRQIVNQTSEGIALSDIDGNYVFVNQAFCKMSGYTEEELLKLTVFDMRAKSQKKSVFKASKTTKQGEIIQVILKRKNGTEYITEIVGRIIKIENTDFVLGTIKDITERIKREEELVLSKEKAEESNRLKTEFINNLSHEIRTPMNGILGFAELLGNSKLSEQKRQFYINIIQNSGNQLLRIIDDILEISRLGTKQVKTFEVEVCINNLLLHLFSIFDFTAKENLTPLYLKNQLTDKASTIYTDDTKLNKILSNLLENSLKFTNSGFVEFGYQLLEIDDNIYMQIYVKDTGIGIHETQQKIIFERFSQADNILSQKFGGLGLGLSIAKENAKLIGGNITLKSKFGKGTTFFVTIPYKAVFSSNNINTTVDDLNKENKIKILIAEDEEINYLYLETLLQTINEGFEIIHAKNGKEAINICRITPEIKLILMDLKMPIINGFEATKQIKKFRLQVTIIAQTAYSTNEYKRKAKLAGCTDFISKPISEKILRQKLKKWGLKIGM